jgi:hypothetical protein
MRLPLIAVRMVETHMLSFHWPAIFVRLKSKPKDLPHQFNELSQEDIRELQRIRAELTLQFEKERLRAMLHQRFML